jgi:hypothetical protein
MAVGSWQPYGSLVVPQTLAESWNGSAWSIVKSLSVGSYGSEFDGVSCTSPTRCTAVGESYGEYFKTSKTLVESWNGTKWSVDRSPNGGPRKNYLSGVSCTGSISCVAVGGWYKRTVLYSLIESWNGSAWTVTPSPNPGGGQNGLSDVSCITASKCVADGLRLNAKPVPRTLIETGSVASG